MKTVENNEHASKEEVQTKEAPCDRSVKRLYVMLAANLVFSFITMALSLNLHCHCHGARRGLCRSRNSSGPRHSHYEGREEYSNGPEFQAPRPMEEGPPRDKPNE